eukprot:CAMPEP_0171998916 /NCGR_PEP_ID=MMETSP1041-20130122/1496_1 /TAXON_ID=464988 /ORGANISM="Hemiselmis andersenii, Strain CCMP439" /LENGTH=91 /DNA_ID=CAMNT_0012652331 /DNA_START=303 /DNA_END=574 /DNA_ORIENTATION=-
MAHEMPAATQSHAAKSPKEQEGWGQGKAITCQSAAAGGEGLMVGENLSLAVHSGLGASALLLPPSHVGVLGCIPIPRGFLLHFFAVDQWIA